MQSLRKAAQQALEELEDAEDLLARLFDAPPDSCVGAAMNRYKAAADTLRAALAEDAMQRLTDVQQEMDGDKLSPPLDRSDDTGKTSDHIADADKMVATIRPEVTVEPVAWSYTDAKGRTVVVIANTAPYEDAKPLYYAPPKRKPISTDMILATWVEECIPKRSTPELVVAFARAIERAYDIGGDE